MTLIKIKEGERLVREVRRHWIVMLGPVLGSFFLVFLPLVTTFVLYFFSFNILDFVSLNGSVFALSVVIYSLWFLFVFIFLTVQWTEYYLDVWYITDSRLVDVEQISLFSRKTKTLSLKRVQDITVEVNGFLATALNYGDIHVQTAGASRKIILYHSKNPYEVKKIISNIVESSIEKNSSL
jgi:uncharacterized membrane protein YdbT with pleckstrin-like domain